MEAKTNLRTSALVDEFRLALLPLGAFARHDAMVDLCKVIQETEDIEESDLEDEFKNGEWYFCTRKDGTEVFAFLGRAYEDWLYWHKESARAVYRIVYLGQTKRYSFEQIIEFNQE